MGHIINLIAKTFIFGNKSETFEADISIAKNTNNLEAAMRLWRKQGAIGILHNLIRFIRASSQKEAIFRYRVRLVNTPSMIANTSKLIANTLIVIAYTPVPKQ